MTTIKSIYHISDIHIKNGLYEDIQHAMDALIKTITESQDRHYSVLVIAGDVFENKTTLTQYDIRCFLSIVNKLVQANIRTIMIPGNHDYNRQNELDLLSPLLMNGNTPVFPHIYVYHKSGIYIHGDVEFHVLSPWDGIIPAIVSPPRVKKVAIVHETIIGGIRYGNVAATTARLSPNDFQAYNITLLGDLHKYQTFGKYKQIAYCGSLVQKDRSEDLTHGYIKWDVQSSSHVFVPIPLRSAYVRLDVRDNTPPVLPTLIAKEIIIEHTNCSDTFIDEVIHMCQTKYSPVVPLTRKDRTHKNIGDTPQTDMIVIGGDEINRLDLNLDTVDNQLQIMSAYLKSINKESYIDAIHTIHRKYARQQPIMQKWSLKYLKWDNIVCYGDDNYVNFNQLAKITSVLGKNKTGKSSLITALLYVLTGSSGRISASTTDDLINKSLGDANITCAIMIGEQEYIISNNLKDTSELYMLRDGFRITHNRSETYTELKNLIGPIEIFKLVSVKIQDAHSIADMKDTTLVKQFDTILGLDILKSIRTSVKSVITTNSSILKYREQTLGPSVSELEILLRKEMNINRTTTAEINTIKTKIKENKKKIREHTELIAAGGIEYMKSSISHLQELEQAMNELLEDGKKKYKEVDNVTEEIARIANIKQKTEVLLANANATYTSLLERRIMLPKKYDLPKTTLTPKEIDQRIEYLNSVIVPIKPLKTNFPIQILKVKIDELAEKYENADPHPIANILDETEHVIPETYLAALNNIDKYAKRKAILESKIDRKLQDRINEAQVQVAEANKKYSTIKYNDSCSHCTANKTTLNQLSGTTAAQQKLDVLMSRLEENTSAMAEYEKISRQLSALQLYSSQNEENILIRKNKIAREFNAGLEEYRNMKHDYLQLTSRTQREELKLLEMHRESRHYDEQRALHDEIEQQIVQIKSDIDAHTKKIQIASRRIDYYVACERVEILHKTIQSKISSETLEAELQDISENLEDLVGQQKSADMATKSIVAAVQKRKEEELAIETMRQEASNYSEYEKMLDPTNLPFKIMKHSMDSIILTVNSILNEICDFQISLDISETAGKKDPSVIKKKLRILIHEYAGTGIKSKREIHSSMGSGFQKFVIDLAFRIAFIKNIPSLPKFLIIDEGFGSLDSENRELAKNALHKIAYERSYIDFILIISHQNEFNDISEKQIVVKQLESKKEKGLLVSRVQFGERLTLSQQRGEIAYTPRTAPNIDVAPAQLELTQAHRDYENRNLRINEVDKIMKCTICDRTLAWKDTPSKRRTAVKSHTDSARHRTNLLRSAIENNIV